MQFYSLTHIAEDLYGIYIPKEKDEYIGTRVHNIIVIDNSIAYNLVKKIREVYSWKYNNYYEETTLISLYPDIRKINICSHNINEGFQTIPYIKTCDTVPNIYENLYKFIIDNIDLSLINTHYKLYIYLKSTEDTTYIKNQLLELCKTSNISVYGCSTNFNDTVELVDSVYNTFIPKLENKLINIENKSYLETQTICLQMYYDNFIFVELSSDECSTKKINYSHVSINLILTGLDNYIRNIEFTEYTDINQVIRIINKVNLIIDYCKALSDCSVQEQTNIRYIDKRFPRGVSWWNNKVINKIDTSNNMLFESILNYSCNTNIVIKDARIKKLYDNNAIKNMKELKQLLNLKKDNTYLKKMFIEEPTTIIINTKEIFRSIITFTDWIEEILSNSGLGLLIKVNTSNSTKIGFQTNAVVENITSTLFPCRDYLDLIISYFSTNEHKSYGDLNNLNLITGRFVGNSNCLIPLYINKYHWECAKKYMNINLGIALTHNPLGYKKQHKSLLFQTLVKMTSELFSHTGENISDRQLIIYMVLWRTCVEVCFENKYNRGLEKYLTTFLSDYRYRQVGKESQYTYILGQILTTGIILESEQLHSILDYMFESIIKDSIYNSKNLLTDLKDIFEKCNRTEVDNQINILLQELKKSHHTYSGIKMIIGFYRMLRIIHSLINTIGGFNKLIKLLSSTYGLLPTIHIEFLKNKIKENKFKEIMNINDLYNEINLQENIENKIICYFLQTLLVEKDGVKIAQKEVYIDFQKYPKQRKDIVDYYYNLYNNIK